ncbi:MAG: translation initiation factor IF-2 subunit alpha, partial [Candidatus Altiarchaeales archaeon HGW-Altiarchaeales-1]
MENFPEEGELVLCTIKKTFDQGAYVTLDEYNREGYLSLKEISLKWIKNIHDYVREE